MLDASFRFKSLMALVREDRDTADFSLAIADIEQRAKNALARISANGTCFFLNTTKRNGREISVPRDFETVLLLRRLNENLRRITRVRQSDRHFIVSCLKQLCDNGLPFVVAKFDIRSFYSNVDTSILRKECHDQVKSSDTTRRILDRFFSDLRSAGVTGVPAGLAISGTLGEILLAKMDKNLSLSDSIHFYSRFVDDIIIIGAPHLTETELTRRVSSELPDGLSLHTAPEKKCFRELPKKQPDKTAAPPSFDYLGYSFSISDVMAAANHDKTMAARNVTIDISASKIRKRKTRFILSLKQFLRDGIELDFLDRFLLINSGYNFYDRGSGRWLSAGMCNSYPLIDFPSNALDDLALFYRNIISSPKSPYSARLRLRPLSRRVRKRIQYFDLNRHVKEKRYVGFSDARLKYLMECWRGA